MSGARWNEIHLARVRLAVVRPRASATLKVHVRGWGEMVLYDVFACHLFSSSEVMVGSVVLVMLWPIFTTLCSVFGP